jgi:hypothetical protein
MKRRSQVWLLGATVLVVAFLAAPSPVASQALLPDPCITAAGGPDRSCDHLKGYTIRDPNPILNPPPTVRLFDQFNPNAQSCTVRTRATHLLVESRKNNQDDPRGDAAGHYLCYNITCPTFPDRVAIVADQFVPNGRQIRILQPVRLCAPTKKAIDP